MQKITLQDYPLAAPLLLEIKHHTALHTILSDVTPGLIYLDNPNDPQISFAQFKHRTFISGLLNAINQKNFRDFFLNQVFENCKEYNVPLFRLTASDPAWIRAAADALKVDEPIFVDYQCYLYQTTSNIKPVHIPDDFIIREVSEELIVEDFEGKADLLSEMCSERTSVNAFLEQSFGIVALRGNKLAGWCLSEYNVKKRCEVGIATMPEFQRQGLAKAMTQTFLNHVHNLGIATVLWHCYKSNVASRKTALSVGFSLHKEEQVLILYMNHSVNAAVHGNICFEEAQYQKALEWYDKALRNNPSHAWIPWNAACAAAQIGQIDIAFTYLNRAVDLGFSDLDHLVQSKHLTSLKSDPRWGLIITRLS